MQAVLWDGYKQIKGELEMDNKFLYFRMIDFEDTDLHLQILIENITHISHEKLFGIEHKALAVHSGKGKINVFVVEDPGQTRQWIESKMIFKP